jgi:RHS repeat-associated protein
MRCQSCNYAELGSKVGSAPFSVRYRDGRAHRLGRGFLGFGTVLTIEDNLNAGRAEVYDNVTADPMFNTYPFAGSLVRSWSWVPEVAGPWSKIAFTYTDWTLEKRDVFPAGLGLTYFTIPIKTHTRKSEDFDLPVGDTLTLLAFVAEHAANPAGELLDTTEEVTSYDDYGNVFGEARATVDVDDFRTVERKVTPDENTWLLGDVTNEKSCSTSLGVTKCQTTSRSYNALGEADTEDRGDPGDVSTTRKTVFTRDEFGNLTLVTADDEFGNHRSACITYEKEGIFPYAFSRAVGQVSRLAFDAGLGVPTALKDANGLTTIWQHDAFGRTTKETGPDNVATELAFRRLKTGGPQNVWWAQYIDTTIAGHYRGREEFDSRGRPVRSWVNGPQVEAQNDGSPNKFLSPEYEVETTYDLLGRVAQRSRPWMTTDPTSQHLYTKYTYDTLGRTLSVTSPWSYKTTYDYSGNTVVTTMPAAGTMLATSSTTEVDPLGRTIEVTDGKSGTTTTTYGPFGAPRAVESPAGLFFTDRDAYGRVITEVDPDRGTTTIDYNGFDEQRRIVDAASRQVTYFYDGLGRRVERRDNGVLSTTWHYDDPLKGYGRLADVTNPGGAKKSYTYDVKGRVSSVALLLAGETFTSSYQYDAAGNVDTVEYPQGPGGAPFRIKNEYDLFDNLTGVRDDLDASHPYYWRLSRVNGVGQTSREIFGNNEINQGHALYTERDYSPEMGAMLAIRTKAGAVSVQDLTYTYDPRLNLTARVDGLQQGVNGPKSERFAYDELDRLTSSYINVACSPAGSCPNSQVLTYGADGNIATKSDVAGGAKYAYDILNGHPHAVASIGSLAYGYDTVGNQISRPGLSIDYTPFDLPKKYTPTSGLPTTFDYDGDQTRIRKTTPDDETVYAGAYERVTHFGMQASPTEHRYYISSDERVVALVTRTTQDTTTAYLHVDHLGSTDVITGGTGIALGQVKERRSYDAFGAKRDPVWGTAGPGSGAAKTTLGFTGHESEGELGLVNMKGRIYDPKVGRFLTTDPLVSHPGFSQSWNPYSYVLNNPLNLVDPSGFGDEPQGGPPPPPIDEHADPTVQEYFNNPEVRAILDSGCIGAECNRKLGSGAAAQTATAVVVNQDADKPVGDFEPPPDEPARSGWADGVSGFLDGLALGAVPFAGVGAEIGMSAGLFEKGNRNTRIGRSVGEMIGGFASALGGVGLGAGGGLATVTVGGAIVGGPALIGAGILIANGSASVLVGAHGLMAALMSKGSGPAARAPASSFPRSSLRGVSTKWLQRNKPSGWREVPSNNGQGWKWLDENGTERLRFTRPNGSNPSASQWSRQANGYFRWQNEAGEFLDIDGGVVSKLNPLFDELTHIMYEGL